MEHLPGTLHPKTMLNTRYTKFVDSLLKSKKAEVAFLASVSASDNRTVMGKTVTRLKNELSCQVITPGLVKTRLKYFPVPQEEEWRLSFLDELLSVGNGESSIDDSFSSADVKAMISSLCTS